MATITTVVARNELLGFLVTIVLDCPQTEAANGARLDLWLGERVHSKDGDLDDSAVLLQPTLLYLLVNGSLDLLREILILYEAILRSNLVLNIFHLCSIEADCQHGFSHHAHQIGRVHQPL